MIRAGKSRFSAGSFGVLLGFSVGYKEDRTQNCDPGRTCYRRWRRLCWESNWAATVYSTRPVSQSINQSIIIVASQ